MMYQYCQSRFATPRYFEKCTLVCQPNYMVGAPCICMAEPEAFQDELIGHIKYMGTPPGPSREVRLRRAPPAAQTPAGGARGGMLSMEAGRARCRPGGPRTQPAPAMWRSTCISYGVLLYAMRAHLGTLRAPPYKYMGHPPCNLADKHLYISKSGQVGSNLL